MESSPAPKNTNTNLYLLSVFIAAALLGTGYLGYELYERTQERTALTEEKTLLLQQNARLIADLDKASTTVTALALELDLTQEELDEVEDDYRDEKRKNDDLEDEYRDTIETVKVLDKLSKTDEELLQKYSRVAFLNENYIPSDLDQIDDKYILSSRSDQYFHGDAIDFLDDLLEDARRDDIDIKVVSAYRSFETQAQLKGQYLVQYGTGANTFSADQGFSEHQLGTAVDFTDTEGNALQASFENTEAFSWLEKNAHKHGFILSYPKGNDFYVFEPWHWRFVGEELADDLHDDRQSFYDLEQRELDQYLLNIFE